MSGIGHSISHAFKKVTHGITHAVKSVFRGVGSAFNAIGGKTEHEDASATDYTNPAQAQDLTQGSQNTEAEGEGEKAQQKKKRKGKASLKISGTDVVGSTRGTNVV